MKKTSFLAHSTSEREPILHWESIAFLLMWKAAASAFVRRLSFVTVYLHWRTSELSYVGEFVFFLDCKQLRYFVGTEYFVYFFMENIEPSWKECKSGGEKSLGRVCSLHRIIQRGGMYSGFKPEKSFSICHSHLSTFLFHPQTISMRSQTTSSYFEWLFFPWESDWLFSLQRIGNGSG